MQYKIFFLIIATFLFLEPFGNLAEALSCAEAFPVIGVVDNIKKEEYFYKISLDRAYTFDPSDFLNEDQTYSIDKYAGIVGSYVANNFELSEKPKSEFTLYKKFNELNFTEKIVKATSLKAGDIIINGPPMHVCSYRFSGIFSPDGKLRTAVINDNYQDYSYEDSKLMVDPGEELKCDGGDRCDVEVNFKLDGKSFTLSPGESYKVDKGAIKAIHLFEGSNLKKQKEDAEISNFNWGFETYVNYVISFENPEIKAESSPQPPERVNILKRIWRWFVSWF